MGPKKKNSSSGGQTKEKSRLVDKDKTSTSKQCESSRARTESMRPLRDINFNVVRKFDLLQRNGAKGSNIFRSGEHIISDRLKRFAIFKIINEFDRRVTCLSWHPTKYFFMAGSKAGDISMFNYTSDGDTFLAKCRWPGPGPGLSILSLHYPSFMDNRFLTASIDGTVKLWELEGIPQKNKPLNTLISTGTIKRWFCSVNTCPELSLILVGDTNGNLISIGKDLKVIATDKVHKGKVNTIEFSRKGGYTFATASLDKTVKLFDLRNLKQNLETFKHEKGVNSAFFSNTSSGRLLTTDQDHKLNIFQGPVWELERTINHPHRNFMHLSPIQASWHPMADLIVVGRYPDQRHPELRHMTLRTVDVFSADSGRLINELYSASCSSISSINVFSPCGDYLASGMGCYIPMWRLKQSSNKHKLEDPEDDENEEGPPKCKKPRRNDENSKSTKFVASVDTKSVE